MKNLGKGTIGLIAVVAVVVLWAISAYNGMVQEQEKATTAFANGVVEARAKATQVTIDPSNVTPEQLKEFQAAQGELSSALSRLLAVQENYPELKANENFKDLQVQLEGTENRINEARNKYNEVVQVYNIYVRKFPKSLLAGIFGFPKMDKFEADAGAQNAPKVSF